MSGKNFDWENTKQKTIKRFKIPLNFISIQIFLSRMENNLLKRKHLMNNCDSSKNNDVLCAVHCGFGDKITLM